MSSSFALEGQKKGEHSEIEEKIIWQIEIADDSVLTECYYLFNIKANELDATLVGAKKKPKVKIEVELEKFDVEDGTFNVINTSPPMWIKSEKDIEDKLKPALEDMKSAAAECDFIHRHCV